MPDKDGSIQTEEVAWDEVKCDELRFRSHFLSNMNPYYLKVGRPRNNPQLAMATPIDHYMRSCPLSWLKQVTAQL